MSTLREPARLAQRLERSRCAVRCGFVLKLDRIISRRTFWTQIDARSGEVSPFPPSVCRGQPLVMRGAQCPVNCALCWACTVTLGTRTPWRRPGTTEGLSRALPGLAPRRAGARPTTSLPTSRRTDSYVTALPAPLSSSPAGSERRAPSCGVQPRLPAGASR